METFTFRKDVEEDRHIKNDCSSNNKVVQITTGQLHHSMKKQHSINIRSWGKPKQKTTTKKQQQHTVGELVLQNINVYSACFTTMCAFQSLLQAKGTYSSQGAACVTAKQGIRTHARAKSKGGGGAFRILDL